LAERRPYFYNQDANIPANEKVPELHRYTAGGTIGGPLIKDKLFAFASYQHIHVSDTGDWNFAHRRAFRTYRRSQRSDGLGGRRNANFRLPAAVWPPPLAPERLVTAGQVDPVALALLNYKLPNGQYLFPSANPNFTPTLNFPENVFLTQPAYFITDQAVADLDYLATTKDTLSLKYYYQHDPTTAPFGYSSFEGFTQHLDAGSQVASITNTQSSGRT
jgi:hypothetical protein